MLVQARRVMVALALAGVSLGCSQSQEEPAPTKLPKTSPAIATKVGFVEVPPQKTAQKYPARMFYSLQAAETTDVDRPLFVLFNGGPGGATTAGMLQWGTGPNRLSITEPGVFANPARLTTLGDVLYMDQRQSGFSYGLEPVSADCRFDSTEDAADFVRVLLAVLESHPSIRDHRVVLVGESYGGIRATQMLAMLLEPEVNVSADPDLVGKILAHHRLVNEHEGTITRAEALRQFGTQILIEPNVFGSIQMDRERVIIQADPTMRSAAARPGVNLYDYRHDVTWQDAIDAKSILAWGDSVISERLLGVPLSSAAGMLPAQRATAFRMGLDSKVLDKELAETDKTLTTQLGALGRNDRYFRMFTPACWDPKAETLTRTPNLFLKNLRDVHTFVTHAKYDLTVRTEAIPELLRDLGGLRVTVDTTPRVGDNGRPGWFQVDLVAEPKTGAPAATIEVRWPPYYDSGHMVAMTEAEALTRDIAQFLKK